MTSPDLLGREEDGRPASAPESLGHALRRRASQDPRRRLFLFLDDGEREARALTCGELDRRARAVAARLQESVGRGERALLLYPPGTEFACALFGCFYAGVVAVPAPLPDPARLKRTLPRVEAILRDADPSAVLTTSASAPVSEALRAAAPRKPRWLETGEVDLGLADAWREVDVPGDALAYLQFTSGSTSAPKGVMASHDNLLHNCRASQAAWGYTTESVAVIWVPNFHDDGLVHGTVLPVYTGHSCVLMPPVSVVQRPERWLSAISRYRATHSGGPNFIYSLAARKVRSEACRDLDLSCWRMAYNAAEPVRHETLVAFHHRFARCGFRWDSFFPSYGLAEATLLVSTKRREGEAALCRVETASLERGRVVESSGEDIGSSTLVSSGRPVAETAIVIADPESGRRRGAGRVGEIWVSNPSVACGYWRRGEETREAFGAVLKGRDGVFLRTGDLGFLRGGELFVTGRWKDLILIRGRNVYPQDVERTVEGSHPLLRPGCSAAFSIDVAGEERLAVVAEVGGSYRESEAGEVMEALRMAVLETHELSPRAVVLLEPGSIPKTSSGKIQRRACRQAFFAGTLSTVGEWTERKLEGAGPRPVAEAPAAVPVTGREDLVRYLRKVVARVLRLPESAVGPHREVFRYGIDSLQDAELTNRVQADLGLDLPAGSFLRRQGLDRLAGHLAELLEGALDRAPLIPRKRRGRAPLSFAQQGLWFLDRLVPGHCFYNVPFALRLTGTLDAAVLAAALSEIERRHETLRTTFVEEEGEPVQAIRAAAGGGRGVPLVDLEALGDGAEAEARRLAAMETRRPFDLETGPLLRLVLFRLGPAEHLLDLNLHHIITDGRSLDVLHRELADLYEALRAGRGSPLAPLPVQYADFAAWQRDRLSGEVLEDLLAYWRRRLADAPVLELPTDRPRRPVQGFRGASLEVRLDAGLAGSLRRLGRRRGATLNMTLLAGLSALLGRYTDREKILVGTASANRTRVEIEDLIGFFVNSLPITVDLSGSPGFREVLERLRETALSAYAHQELPFERLVEELSPDPDLSRNTLFQVMFVWQNVPVEPRLLPGLRLEPVISPLPATRFDLEVHLWETAAGIEGFCTYDRDLFNRTTIRRLIMRFQTLLESALEEPTIAGLDLLAPEERQQLLVEWNNTAAPLPEVCAHTLFEAQAAKAPDAAAVLFENEVLSYGALNARANRLAHRLIGLGVGPDVLVAIALARSPAMIVALLATLKAGGAYVPLDPEYPTERLAFMLEDSGARVLLTAQGLCGRWPETVPHVLCLENEVDRLAEQPLRNLECAVSPRQLAYVMYTSGSTGRPKGTAVAHQSVVRLIRSGGCLRFAEEDVFLQMAPLAFDASSLELWAPLLNGARLVQMPPGTPSLAAIGHYVRVHGVTTLWLTAGLFHLMVDERLTDLAGVRRLLAGGEVLSAPHVQKAVTALGTHRVINGYGPTENATFTCCYPVPDAEAVAASVPIGRAIGNTRIFVLNGDLQPTPLGVPGELATGGAGLARGYLARAGLTAERFIAHPFSETPGKRLYKTGDLVRYRADGNVEFLGRLDNQVKIRGFRIEPGEIEAALAAREDVREAVVMARGEGAERQLVAYVVAQELDDAELQKELAASLPGYMVPAVWVPLEALPLTANGKFDRAALGRATLPEMDARPPGAAPRDALEEILAGLWATVLKRGAVGIGDSFFELGGHSLLATQLTSRLRDALGVDVPVHWVFEAPTVAELAERLRPAAVGASARAPRRIPRAPRDCPLPLSFAQQRLWFLDQLEGPGPTYNMPLALDLRGALDPGALRAALAGLVGRHEALRTCFIAVGSEPIQQIQPPVDAAAFPLPHLDLRHLSHPEAEARRLGRAEALTPFDLARDIPLRATLIRRGDASWTLLTTLHHSAADGWSMPIFIRELAVLYRALQEGRPPPLPELEIQYADFALWQRGELRGKRRAQLLEVWRERLAGAPERLDLPTDHPRPPRQSYRGSAVTFGVDAGLARGLEALSRRSGATLFMSLCSIWTALLARYSGEDDLVIGSPVAGRTRSAVEPLIGFFVNTLALRVDLSGAPSFLNLLGRVRAICLEAYAHQELPFEVLVEALGIARHLSHAPLFQVMLALQNVPSLVPLRGNPEEALELPGLEVSLAASETSVAKFDLTLSIHQAEEGLLAHLEYASDLFERATVQRLGGHFRELLGSILARPEEPLEALNILSLEERQQLLVDWNATVAPLPEACVHTLFEAHVTEAPDAAAVLFEDEVWSYGALNARANQLAHMLIGLGVGPEVLVAIALERSPAMIVALIATLKAGGAYVPLDPEYPRDRLAFMLEDSASRVVITERGLRGRWPETLPPVLCLENDVDRLAEQPRSNLECAVSPRHLAYVMYTSGSTGRPKGTAVAHQCVVRLIRSGGCLRFAEDEVFLQIAPLAFDASTLELWAPLLNGARLVQMPPGTPSLADIGHYVRRYGVTTLHLTAGLFHLMVDERLADLAGVRRLIAGGEVLSAPHVRKAATALGAHRVVNAYGPTENTTFTCCYPVPGAAGIAASVPIGRAIGNTRIFVLDGDLQPMPLGVAGELATGGAGLARGYLARAGLTAERFIAHPFSERPGERLYKTGDLVRYRADGNVEFLGRLDTQVKIRGFRIEPGEIEAALAAREDVREAVVMARGEGAERQLVAYVVAQGLDSTELRGELAARLPDFMVPAAWVFLEALPLTSNGKVDRAALGRAAPGRAAPGRAAPGRAAAPRDALEEILAGLWATVLKRGAVGIAESFFELGGHSLLATQLASRLNDALNVDVPVRWIFEAPTVAELAERLRPAVVGASAQAPRRIPRAPRDRPLPLSFAQQRLWFLDQLEGPSPTYNMPLAFDLRGALDPGALRAALAGLAGRHEALRTCFIAVGSEPVQQIQPPVDSAFPLPHIDLRNLSYREAEAQRLARAEALAPFDLARDIPLRATLIRRGDASWTLLTTLHHSAADGWSMPIFIRELAVLYRALQEGRPPPLPELEIQYADFALWQRGELRGKRRAQLLEVWRERLAGAPERLDLPTDHPRPPRQSYRGSAVTFGVDAGPVRGLEALSRRSGATLFMSLCSIWTALLARYSGEEDLVIGSPLAGRTRSAIEPLIGFFVNTLALRVDLSGAPSFLNLLGRVRAICLEAYAHQELPFEVLVEALGIARHLSHAPLFQVMLALQNVPSLAPLRGNPEEALELPGLEVSPAASETSVAKFDLTLSIHQAEQGFKAHLEYASDLFERATVQRLGGHFRELLGSILARPEEPSGALNILSLEERQQLLVDGNSTVVPLPEVCAHTLFEAHATRAPDAAAVLYENEVVSYGALDARANRLAHRLIGLGVGPDVLVAIAVERSPAMIVALLATLKSGGAYVPLDPEYPTERLAFMLEDSGARVLLTAQGPRGRWPEAVTHVLHLEREEECLAEPPRRNPESVVSPRHLAYVMYTSGSTGRPKGAAIEHRGLSSLALAQIDAFGLTSGSRVLQFASFSFDASIFEIMMAYGAGAVLKLPNAEARRPGAPLQRLLEEAAITHLTLPPTALAALTPSDRLGLRTLIVAGEPCLPASAALWSKGRRFFNAYGPTEATVCSSLYEVSSRDSDLAIVPMGRPLSNTSLYSLARHLHPAPFGVPGELHVGGAGLARGYVARAGLTAERFIAHPFSETPGKRLYKTGDLVRYRADGNVEFLGRLDTQVKIRGFRIELGEIEAALAARADIRDAVVMASGEGAERRLVAYVVARELAEGPARPDPAELRGELAARLPAFMVPAVWVPLEALPLTPNGKVDRAALGRAASGRAASGRAASGRAAPARQPLQEMDGRSPSAVPRDALEEILAGLWATVLKRGAVGIDDSFFELGGHSLLATRLTSRLREALEVDVPVHWIFEAPTVAALAERLRRVGQDGAPVRVPANRILPGARRITPDLLPLIRLTQHEIDRIVDAVPGGTDNIQDIYPLAPLQEGILFHHQVQEKGDSYLSHALLAFDSENRSRSFISALQAVVDRHDILRTAILWEGLSEPVQVVWRQADLPVELRLFDPAQGPIAEQMVRSSHPRVTRLDLSRAPLLRLVLAQDRDRWLLLFLSHHLIMDHTTLGVMLEEVMAHLEGDRERLPEPVQYRNFVAQALGGVSLEQHKAFFREMLGSVESPTLPFDLADVMGDGSRMCEARREVPATLSRRLREQSRRHGVTPAALCHLAWALVLSRCSSQDDVVFGTVLFGRMQGGEGVERTLGMFINTLPLRIRCGVRPAAVALVETQRLLLALLRHEHASLHMAQRCGAFVPSPRAPLFSALLNYRHSPLQDGDHRPALEGVEVLQAEERTNYPFGLSVDDLGEGFVLTAQVEVVLPERICGFMRCALQALAGVLEEAPQTPLDGLDLLAPEERHQLLVDWNSTAASLPEACVHTLFEARAAEAPDAAAVLFAGEVLSYGALDARANQMAHLLIGLGVDPDVLVTITLARSPAMIVALLATLKAGGAYVPLDPNHPTERLAFMVEDSRALILITEQGLRGRLPEAAPHVLSLEDEGERLAEQPLINPGRAVSPRHLAYVIYTSGSSGRPKGVAVEHHSISSHCHDIKVVYELATTDRVLQFSSFSFDASIEQILPTLYSGAAIVLPEDSVRERNALAVPRVLDRFIERHKISVANVPPAFFEQWVMHLEPRTEPSTLRLLQVGGEAFPARSASRWHEAFPEAAIKLLNCYGPTETTITATCYDAFGSLSGRPVPIGRPLPRRSVYILDRRLRLTPVGVPGELEIGGAGLARGYLARPGLAAERFIAHPFSGTPGERLYKTGDLVRYRADGNVEFLGRLDSQIKIRGFRIELGEIEAALAARGDVREAVVMARGEGAERQLVAFVVAQKLAAGPARPDPSELRGELAERLPDYMVPAVWVFLEALPLHPNGKVDRAALGRAALDLKDLPEARRALLRISARAPRDGIERQLVEIWETLLDVQPIGIEDSFFQIGGHSLLAVRLVAEVEKHFGRQLPWSRLFELQTIADIASWLRDAGSCPEDSCLVKIRSRGSRAPIFIIPGIEGYVSNLYSLATYLDPEVPFFAFQARGLDGVSEPHPSLESMSAHYVELLLEVQPHGPYVLAGYSFGGKVAFAMAQILLKRGQEIVKLIILDASAPSMNGASVPLPDERQLIEMVMEEYLFDEDERDASGTMEEMSSDQLLSAAAQRLETAELVPWGLGVRFMRGLIRVLEASYRMLALYRPQCSRPLPIALIRALDGIPEALAGEGEDLGWGRYSSQPVSIRHVSGKHTELMTSPHVEVVAEHLTELMELDAGRRPHV